MTEGQYFTATNRIVGPEQQALALAESLNDLQLHIAFLPDDKISGSRLYTRRMMASIDVDYPVLVLPESARAQWESDPNTPAHIKPHDGPLPATERVTTFGIVTPGQRPCCAGNVGGPPHDASTPGHPNHCSCDRCF